MNDPRAYARSLQQDAKAVADNVRDGAGQVAGETTTLVRRAANDISDTAELTLEQLKEQVTSLKADITKLVTSTAETGYDYVGGHVGDAVSGAENFIRERPATAWGVAAGVGILLAYLLSRR